MLSISHEQVNGVLRGIVEVFGDGQVRADKCIFDQITSVPAGVQERRAVSILNRNPEAAKFRAGIRWAFGSRGKRAVGC